MPMNTRNAANRPTVQTETSKSKKLPAFLLKGLKHTNNEYQDEESSSYSEVENLPMQNSKRVNSNAADSRNKDRLAKKTRIVNENEMEMHDSNLLVADSSHITHLEELSPPIQQNDNQASMLYTSNIYQPPSATPNAINVEGDQPSSMFEQQDDSSSMNNQMDLPLEQHVDQISVPPSNTSGPHHENLPNANQHHDNDKEDIDSDSINQQLPTHSTLTNDKQKLNENPSKAEEIQQPQISGPHDTANIEIDNHSHYTTYFYKQSDFKDYKDSKIEPRTPKLFSGKRFIS
ncbi:unnamed protein product [Rotaria sp. Silwood1]|nr:unnamed protein product [Rotaria sp. Silwood1]